MTTRSTDATNFVVRLWHDDIRRPPEDMEWFWARTNDAAMAVLNARHVDVISLDHDLGLHHEDPGAPAAELGRGQGEQTGYVMQLADGRRTDGERFA
jgi:hypothetical protein